MKTFIIRFRVWIGKELALTYTKMQGKSREEVEQRFWNEKHIMPVSIEEFSEEVK